jgi:plasmid stabilization system protein ParE
MYSLAYSKLIRGDIRSSYDYIKEKLEAPKAAENLIIEMINKLHYLKETPFAKPLVQDSYLASFGMRSMKIKNYVLYYIVDEENNKVNMIRFLYGKRDWMNILKENSIEEIM